MNFRLPKIKRKVIVFSGGICQIEETRLCLQSKPNPHSCIFPLHISLYGFSAKMGSIKKGEQIGRAANQVPVFNCCNGILTGIKTFLIKSPQCFYASQLEKLVQKEFIPIDPTSL